MCCPAPSVAAIQQKLAHPLYFYSIDKLHPRPALNACIIPQFDTFCHVIFSILGKFFRRDLFVLFLLQPPARFGMIEYTVDARRAARERMDHMDDSFFMIFDLISLGCGIYLLYTYIKLRMAGRLFPSSLLIPKDRSPKDCKDSAAYIRYIQPRMLMIGILITLFGAVSLVNEYLHFLSFYASIGSTFAAFAVVVWYGVCSGKANRRYF